MNDKNAEIQCNLCESFAMIGGIGDAAVGCNCGWCDQGATHAQFKLNIKEFNVAQPAQRKPNLFVRTDNKHFV